MKVILIDDELIALDLLTIVLDDYKDIEIVGKYTDPYEALKDIKTLKPDTIFLDIEMGEANGLLFAEEINKELETADIVFVTAYSQYAVDAFEINAIDYLLKPIQEKRLKKTIDRLRDKLKFKGTVENTEKNMRINSLGSFYILDDEQNHFRWRTQKTKELFAYLWANQGRAVSRIRLMEDIFPDKDMDKAITLLHTTVYQLRKNLSYLGYKDAISYVNESYQLDINIDSDLQRLDNLIALNNYEKDYIKEILNLYRGDIFQEEGYHWALEKQLEYKERVMGILKDYVREQIENGNYSKDIKCCLDKVFLMDPYNEDAARMIIKYYGVQGKKGSLKTFYNKFKNNFVREIGISLEDDTINIYNYYMK